MNLIPLGKGNFSLFSFRFIVSGSINQFPLVSCIFNLSLKRESLKKYIHTYNRNIKLFEGGGEERKEDWIDPLGKTVVEIEQRLAQ